MVVVVVDSFYSINLVWTMSLVTFFPVFSRFISCYGSPRNNVLFCHV